MSVLVNNRQGRILVAGLIALPLIFLAVFYAYPLYELLVLSLKDFEPVYQADDFIGLENYRTILTDPENLQFYLNTFIYVAICVAASFVLAMGFAVTTTFVARQISRRLGSMLRMVIMLPMIVIPATASVMWAFAFTEHYGWVNHLLALFGARPYPWLVTSAAFYLVMLADIWSWTPFLYIIFLSALQSLPEEPIEAANIDGASGWQIFWHVTLPMMRPVMGVALTIKILDTYKAFDYLWIMTKGGPGVASTTLNIVAYETAFLNFNFGLASAYGVVTMVFPVAAVLFMLLRRRRTL